MIPIFIITYDRLTVLKECLNSIQRCVQTPYQIIIHDNNSTYEPLREFLTIQQRSGIIVEWGCKGESIYNIIRSMVKRWTKVFNTQYYVVTDPDISLDTKPDVLEFYAHLLEKTKVDCVGPHGILDDIPLFNPMRQHCITGHRSLFWSMPTKIIEFSGHEYEYSDKIPNTHIIIDTSFALYKTGVDILWESPENKKSIRTHPPYAARHLDWYINPLQMPEDHRRYLWTAHDVSHCRQIFNFIPKLI